MKSSCRVYRFTVRHHRSSDPRSAGLLSSARALGFTDLERLECADLYFVSGSLDAAELDRLGQVLLSDPVTQTAAWRAVDEPAPAGNGWRVEVALRPGVTDPVAEQIVRAAREIGVTGLEQASTGFVYDLAGAALTAEQVDLAARRLLANAVIHRYALGEIEPAFSQLEGGDSGRIEWIAIREMDEAALLACSAERRAALDLTEMRAIQDYYRAQGRDCSDIEFEMIAQTWSEHCVHKTFKALIDVDAPAGGPYPARVDSVLKTYIRRATDEIAAPWVISAFSDNAGIIELDDEFEISFKVETHNHPSAIEPFGGANTGVGGVIRDVLGVSAKPIAATDVLCFGPLDADLNELPEGVLHPQRIFSGVVGGVQDYGNKIGIPTVNGAVWFDPGYTANPLVYCGCVGIAPRGKHQRTPQPGDRVIVLGGRTGRDGLRGATFSSMTMDAQTGEVSGASVQIGAPITEKIVTEVLLRARDLGLYHAVTDCGAGGLSSAVGEMASTCGGDVDLANAPLKYPGLAPWEIWLSEAQERMVMAVPPVSMPALVELCELFDVEWTDLGVFNDTGRLIVRYAGQPVLELDNVFLHDGIPQRRLRAAPPAAPAAIPTAERLPEAGAALKALLGHANIASREPVIRLYDHEVQGGTCVKPLAGPGAGPSDGCVLKPAGVKGKTGLALSNGFNPEYGKRDAYRMAWCAVDEAVRNAVAAGGDPDRMAILDNFCWGDPLRTETMWTLLEAARGCYDAARRYGTPFVSGKDSFNNEYLTRSGKRESIPPSLLISAIAVAPDVTRAMTSGLKQAGSALYLVGNFQPAFGGSHFAGLFGCPAGASDEIPLPGADAPAVYRALHQAILRPGVVLAAHDLSEGGLAVAAAEMCLGGELGAQICLPAGLSTWAALFGETAGTLLVEAAAGREAEFEALFAGLPCLRVGQVCGEAQLSICQGSLTSITEPVDALAQAWRKPLQPEVQ